MKLLGKFRHPILYIQIFHVGWNVNLRWPKMALVSFFSLSFFSFVWHGEKFYMLWMTFVNNELEIPPLFCPFWPRPRSFSFWQPLPLFFSSSTSMISIFIAFKSASIAPTCEKQKFSNFYHCWRPNSFFKDNEKINKAWFVA